MKRVNEGGTSPSSKRFQEDSTSYLIFLESNLTSAAKLLSLLSPLFPALSSEDLREVAAEILGSSVADILGQTLSPTDLISLNEAAAELRENFRSFASRKPQDDFPDSAPDEGLTVSDLLRSAAIPVSQQQAVLSALAEEQADQLENKLMEIFDFSQPDLVSRLLDVFHRSSRSLLLAAVVRPVPEFRASPSLLAEAVPHPAGHPWDEVQVRSVNVSRPDVPLIPVASLPEAVQTAFPGVTHLNPVQSRVFPAVYQGSRNVLISAPTGAGKTNIAVLALFARSSGFLCASEVLDGSSISGPNSSSKGSNSSSNDSILYAVYLAPMRALVREVVENLRQRFPLIPVSELSGDSDTSVSEALGSSAIGSSSSDRRIIVATPEKWDVVSRKLSFTQLSQVKLLIIDEIHLLDDESRGPVLEFIVARHKPVGTRVIGLSATIPNAAEIAKFLDDAACEVFGPEFRPVQLTQKYIGVHKSKSAVKQQETMNLAVYEEALVVPKGGYSVLVFVHSRRDTYLTGKWLLEKAVKEGTIGYLVGDIASREVIKSVLSSSGGSIGVENKELLEYGIGIHHAGLKVEERKLVESLFADSHIKVLVSTLTLAVGVNLPSRKVIIKGTTVGFTSLGSSSNMSSSIGSSKRSSNGSRTISSMDMLQMLGRAGRPQFDKEGQGVVITRKEDLGKIMALANSQVSIESGVDGERLAEGINAEVARGAIATVDDGVEWAKRLFWYVRQGLDRAVIPQVMEYLVDKNLIRKGSSQRYHSTAMGQVISEYYLRFPTYSAFEQGLTQEMDEGRVLEVFAQAQEFEQIKTRPEETVEIARVTEILPIPMTGTAEVLKVGVLLQSYIGRKVGVSPVFADLPHITGTAGRLLRALTEIALRKGFAETARTALRLAKATDAQMWPVGQSALRQIPGAMEIAKRIEKRGLSINEIVSMDPETLGNVVKAPKLGTAIHKLVRSLPRLQVTLALQPLGRSLLSVEAEIFADWVAGFCKLESFWIILECGEGRRILYSEKITISEQQTKIIKFTLPLFDPLHAVYYFRAISDRFFVDDCVVPLRLDQLVLPPKLAKFRASDAARALIDEAEIRDGLVVSAGDAEIAKLVIDRLARADIPDIAVVVPEFWNSDTVLPWPTKRASEWELATRLPKQRREIFGRHKVFLCLGVDELDWRYEVFLGRAKDVVKLVCVSGNLFPNISDLAVWLGIEQAPLSFGLVSSRDVEIATRTNFRSEDLVTELEFIQSDTSHVTVIASGRLARELPLDDVLAIEVLKRDSLPAFAGAVALLEDREFSREELNAVLRRTKRGERIYLFCSPGRRGFLEKFLTEGVAVESALDQHLSDLFATAVAVRSVKNKQDAVEVLTNTYLYQRVQMNPNYYGLGEVSGEAVSAWLSEAVELGVETSEGAKEVFTVGEDEFDVSPTSLATICAHHGVSVSTILACAAELPSVARKKQLIGLVAKSGEMLEIAGDDRSAGALLVGWLRRQTEISSRVREISVSLLEMMVDVAVAIGNIKTALFAVELMAAFTQAVEPGTSPLQQLPHFEVSRAQKAKELFGIEDVLEIGDLPDEDRAALFEGFTESEISSIAQFCNDVFPSPQLAVTASESEISVEISELGQAKWWLFVVEQESDEIVFFRKLQISDSLLKVPRRRPGPHTVYAMCGSFVGCDIEEVLE